MSIEDVCVVQIFFFQAEDGIRDAQESRGLGDVYKRQTKTRKAVDCGGAAFMNVLSSCNRGWRHPADETIEITQLAVDTCYWPLFEVEDGQWRLTYKPKEKPPVEEWLKRQGRFRHLFKPENRHIVDEFQADVDRRWARRLRPVSYTHLTLPTTYPVWISVVAC